MAESGRYEIVSKFDLSQFMELGKAVYKAQVRKNLQCNGNMPGGTGGQFTGFIVNEGA